MKKLEIIFIVIFITLNLSSATLIHDGSIVLLRSQFIENGINVDGTIDSEDNWKQAGTLAIDRKVGNITQNVKLKFVNDNEFLYFSLKTNTENTINNSFAILFDVDGDGVLNTPEDGKSLSYSSSNTFSSKDLYWDDTWMIDDSLSGNDDEFKASSKYNAGNVVYELGIGLVASNYQFDGWQIPNPANTYIAFNFQIVSILDNTTILYNYPTDPANVSGYVDLKLAGPEDVDLPKYIPPTEIEITDTYNDGDIPDVNEAVGLLGAEAPGFLLPITIAMLLLVPVIRRRKL